MRIAALFLLAFLSYGKLQAQGISGFAGDEQGKPLPGASVALKNSSDSSIVKLDISDTGGHYRFLAIPPGNYFVTISHLGYLQAGSAAFRVGDNGVFQVASINLSPVAHELQEAEVTGLRPLVEARSDRIILHVENSINAIGEDALELLRKSPGVTVDNSNTLGINGRKGVQIYVDGRPTYLSGADLAAWLKTIHSSSIESIEIIANPSVRYEAAGSAGIIDIRLKKDKTLGTNLTAAVGYSIGTYSKYIASLTFNHRDRHVNIFGDYTYDNSTNVEHSLQNRTLLDTMFLQNSSLVTQGVGHTFKTGVDLYLGKKSTLGVLVSGSLENDSIRSNSATPIVYIPTNTTSRLLRADNRTAGFRDNYNFNLNYHFADSSGHELTLNADYGLYRIRSNQLQPNNYYDSTGKDFLYSSDYNILTPTDIDIYSFKADYNTRFLKGQLALGAKTSYVTSENDFVQYERPQSAWILDSLGSNHFDYKENINAAYVNYSRNLKGWNIQAGLRVENTNSSGNSTGWQEMHDGLTAYDSSYPRHYTDLFPNVSVTLNKNPLDQWTLSYGRRIDRPDYQDLNPFEFKIDDYTFSKGNTQLQPQYADNIGLSWLYKNKLSAALGYSHISNLFATIPDTTDRSKTIVTKVNLANQDIASLAISYPFRYKWYNIFANITGFYALYKANFGGPGRVINENVFNTTIYTQHVFQLGNGWKGNITQFFTSPNIWESTLRSRSLWSLDAGLQKTFLGGNGTIKASVSDIFNGMRWSAASNFTGQYILAKGYIENRQLKLYFTYRFGNSQVKAARRHDTGAEDENRRVSTGAETTH